MFYMWTCFSLLCAATILQSSASNAVSLKCNDTVEVVAGEDVTLNCRIIEMTGENCKGLKYHWSNSHGDIQCNSDLKHICGWENPTHVYLTISNINKEDNYTITVQTDCGIVEAYAVQVRVIEGKFVTGPSASHGHVIPTILGIFITIAAAAGILCFLFRTDRGRQIISR
ncbi:uncharacterized protein LOC122970953, partial [Scomber scombrus]